MKKAFTVLVFIILLLVSCAHSHNYVFSSFEWSNDGKSAQCKYVCANDNTHIIMYDAEVTSTVKVEATCERRGITVYTATYDGHTDTKEVEDINALGHNYKFDSFVWIDDNKTAVAKYVCEHDNEHVETHEAIMTTEIITPAGYETEGLTRYTATYDNHTEYKDVVTEPLGGGFVFDSFIFGEDGKTAQIRYIKDNEEKFFDAGVTSEKISDPTCEEYGVTRYTATYDTHSDYVELHDIESLGHDYVFDSIIFLEDGTKAQAKYVCSRDPEHEIYYDAEVTSEVKKTATCEEGGITTYTATYDGHTATKDVDDIEPLGHDYQFDSFVWSEDGKTAQAKYVCTNDNSHIELHSAEVTSEVKTAATCEAKGVTLYTATYDGHSDTKEIEDINSLGHNYELNNIVNPTFDEDGYSVYKCSICKNEIHSDFVPKKEVVYTITINYLDGIIVRVDDTGNYALPEIEKPGYELVKFIDNSNNDFNKTGTIASSVEISPIWSIKETTNIDQLEEYLSKGVDYIKIANNIEINRTLYVTGNSVIYSSVPVTLTRKSDFSKDMFVLGEDKEGNNCLIEYGNCSLNIGKFGELNQITIDGNKDNLTCDVIGSVFFIANSSFLNIYDGVTIVNNYKTGNEKALVSKYYLSSAEKAGGSVALLSNGVMNIYGGEFSNNSVNEENDNITSSFYGGVIYNNANVNIYGGLFKNNYAGRGGFICNYKMCRIYAGTFEENEASKYGGAFYLVDSQYSELIIGDTDIDDIGSVQIQNNTSNASGGAIFAQTLSAIIIYNNAVFTSNSSLTGNGGAINCSGVLLDYNSKYKDNDAYSKGGAIYLYYGDNTLTRRQSKLTSVKFEGNTANRGGALGVSTSDDTYAIGCFATIIDCEFKLNKAEDKDGTSTDMHGGAIYVSRKSEVSISKSSFISNTSLSEGGAIYETGESHIEILNSTFTNNSSTLSTSNGGAISLHSSYLKIEGSSFDNNESGKNGGSIYNSYTGSSTIESQLFIKESSFTQNSSSNYGGAIYITGRSTDAQNVNIYDSSFEGNASSGNGGAIYVTSNSIYLKNVDFISNVSNSSNYGGAAIYSTGGVIEYDGGSLKTNISAYNGGAIALYSDSVVTLNGLTFEENNTTNYGGAIYLNKTNLTIYTSNFINNNSKNGGAIALYTSAKMNVYSTSFEDNTVSNNGGAVYAYTGSTEKSYVVNSLFKNNESPNYGGAIYISQATLLGLEDVEFVGNSALNGGVMYITTTGTTVDIAGITVNNNSATAGPIVYGNTTKAIVNYDSSLWTDELVSNLDSDYWTNAFVNKVSANDVSLSKSAVSTYQSKSIPSTMNEPYEDNITFDDIYAISQNSSNDLIDPSFANYPILNNPLNFQGRFRKDFIINKKNISVESFVYENGIAQNNPNVGEGLMIWQAILYKRQNPDKDVYIDFTSFHLSVYAAVCINRNSRYFGYMYPLHNCEFNDFGFVRISYLLVLAAKMGIKTTVIGQIDGANNVIRDNDLGIVTIPDASFVNYFNKHLSSKTFNNEEVSKYLKFRECKWTSYGDKAATDMMHVKTCTVSNYLDFEGIEHDCAVFFSSINLDSLSFMGLNYGQNSCQTGVIISDHYYLYNVTHNYVQLLSDYCEQEDIYLFRTLINKTNLKQIYEIEKNGYDLIETNKLIVYLGNQDDHYFRLYFTPLGGNTNVYDNVLNPICNEIDTFSNSDDSVLINWNCPNFKRYTLSDYLLFKIQNKLIESVNSLGKFRITIDNPSDFNFGNSQIGFTNYTHNKDIFLSYSNNCARYYVSILNSVNMHSGSLYFQCNHILIICEEDINNSIFQSISHITSEGYIS